MMRQIHFPLSAFTKTKKKYMTADMGSQNANIQLEWKGFVEHNGNAL